MGGNPNCGMEMGRFGKVVVFGSSLALISGEENAVLWAA